MSGSTYCRHFWETLTESPGSGITGFILSEAANHCAACSFAPPGASRDTHQSTFGYPNWPSTPSQLSSNDFVPVSDSGSFYFTPSDAPQGAHQAVNVDRFDSAFDTAFLPDTPRYAHHADWFYAPLQSSQSTHRTATDERSLDSANYFLGPSDAPHSAHQSDNEKFLNQNLGYAHCSSCSPQAPQDPHNATDWGRLAPTLSSTGVAIDDCPFPQYNGDTPYNEQFNNILNDGITDFGGLNNFISSSCPTSETTSPTGISPQPNGAALPSQRIPVAGISPAVVNARFNSNRISCTHIGCPATFGRPGDFRRHAKKHLPPEHSCPVETCKREFYRLDKLRDHQRKKHGMSD